MKTIKELADDLGVSKTAVMKKIDNLGLREKLESERASGRPEPPGAAGVVSCFAANAGVLPASKSPARVQPHG